MSSHTRGRGAGRPSAAPRPSPHCQTECAGWVVVCSPCFRLSVVAALCREANLHCHIYYTYDANPFSNNTEIEGAKLYGAHVSVASENTVRSALLAGEEKGSLFLPFIGVKMSNKYLYKWKIFPLASSNA